MQRKRGTGISSEVRHSVRTIAVLLALPVVIGLIVMILYSSRYQAMIGRMDAAQLKAEQDAYQDQFALELEAILDAEAEKGPGEAP